MIIFFIFENFENRQKMKFLPTADLGDLFGTIHMCPFFIQMSEFVYFSCPGVRM